MAYFPNATSWEYWAPDNCFRCSHWPKDDDAPPCPVETAHMLYNYEQCKDTPEGKAIEAILDMLIPRTKDDLGNEKCAMFSPKNGVTDRHLKDWAKYKQVMEEMSAASPAHAEAG